MALKNILNIVFQQHIVYNCDISSTIQLLFQSRMPSAAASFLLPKERGGWG